MLVLRAIVIAALVVSLVGAASAQMVMVENGRPNATIVVGAEHSRTDAWCAGELQTWIRAITDVELPIATDDEQVEGNVLAVGRNRFTEELYETEYEFEQFVLKTLAPNVLAFAGWATEPAVNRDGEWVRDRERGPLYAVYHFLEDLGVRWFFPGDLGTYTPRTESLTAGPYDVDKTPASYYRWAVNSGTSADPQWNQDVRLWALRSRLNTWLWGAEDKGGYLLPAYGGHNFHQVVPKALFDERPDWFPLIRGERTTAGQLCLGNPEVLERFANVARGSFARDTGIETFSIWPEDRGDGWCECDQCRAMDGPDGNVADRLVKFSNQVQELLAEEYPDRQVYTAAYTPAYFSPPTTVEANPDVWVQVCRYWPVGDSTSTYSNQMSGQAEKYYRDLRRWTELANVFLYTYYGFYASNLYYPVTYRIFEDWPVKISWGVKGGYSQTNQQWATNGWVYYAFPRVMFDPWMDEDQFRRDYFSKCYGSGGEDMRSFFEVLEEKFRATRILQEWETVEALHTPEVMERMEAYLSGAEAATTNDDEGVRWRLDFARRGFDFAKEYLAAMALLEAARAGDQAIRMQAIEASEANMALQKQLQDEGLLGVNERSVRGLVDRMKLDLWDLPVGPFTYSDYYKQGGLTKVHARQNTFMQEYWGLTLPPGLTGRIVYGLGSREGVWQDLQVTFDVDRKSPPGAVLNVSVDNGHTWQEATEALAPDGTRLGRWVISEAVAGHPTVLISLASTNDADQTRYVLISTSMRGTIVERE